MNPAEITQVIGALVVAMAGLKMAYDKYSVTRKKDGTTVASEEAQTTQYKLLQDAIKSNHEQMLEMQKRYGSQLSELQERLIEVTAVVQVMDKTIHRQQRTITRMEMLLRQFSGLVSQNGIKVPGFMQQELEQLIETDADRLATAEFVSQEPRTFG